MRYITEAPGLAPVTENGEWLVIESLTNERRDNSPISQPHPGTVGIEDPDDLRVHFMEPMVRHGHRFREALSLVVYAARSDRIDMPPVLFALGGNPSITVPLPLRAQYKVPSFS